MASNPPYWSVYGDTILITYPASCPERYAKHAIVHAECLEKPTQRLSRQARRPFTARLKIYPRCSELFNHEAENENKGFFRRFALVLGPGKGRGGSARSGLQWLKSYQRHRQDKHRRGPSTPRRKALCLR